MVKIAVLGCGNMGIKIAGELAYHGHRVKVYDTDVDTLNNAFNRIEEDKQELYSEGLISQKTFVGHILCMSRLEETVNDAEFIFECVYEDLAVKQDLFERASHCCSKDAVITTNTLRLDVADVADRVANKERTLGLRFLFPVYFIPEVEVTASKHTSASSIEKVRILLQTMGKTLFFRSGAEPLVLTEDQRDIRRQARLEQVRKSSGLGNIFENRIPALGHRGNALSFEEQQTKEPTLKDRDCAICMDRQRNCVLSTCHHMVTCLECAKMLLNRCDGCPICRKTITDIIKVYHS